MEQEKRYRHEMKYSIPYTDYLAVRARLRSVMEPDRHTMDDGTYRIRSIYFDNTDDKALREKIDGIGKREKFRIRYYNDDLSFISLEKKMKIDSLCLKYDAVITVDECRKILDGDLDFMKEHPEALHLLGRCYLFMENGDSSKASELFEKAASLGNVQAAKDLSALELGGPIAD